MLRFRIANTVWVQMKAIAAIRERNDSFVWREVLHLGSGSTNPPKPMATPSFAHEITGQVILRGTPDALHTVSERAAEHGLTVNAYAERMAYAYVEAFRSSHPKVELTVTPILRKFPKLKFRKLRKPREIPEIVC